MTSGAYHGPVLVPTLTEVARIRDALTGHRDPLAQSIVAKCDAALNADPRLRKPVTR